MVDIFNFVFLFGLFFFFVVIIVCGWWNFFLVWEYFDDDDFYNFCYGDYFYSFWFWRWFKFCGYIEFWRSVVFRIIWGIVVEWGRGEVDVFDDGIVGVGCWCFVVLSMSGFGFLYFGYGVWERGNILWVWGFNMIDGIDSMGDCRWVDILFGWRI